MKQFAITIHYNTWNTDLTENNNKISYYIVGTSTANAKAKAVTRFKEEVKKEYKIIKTTFIKLK